MKNLYRERKKWLIHAVLQGMRPWTFPDCSVLEELRYPSDNLLQGLCLDLSNYGSDMFKVVAKLTDESQEKSANR